MKPRKDALMTMLFFALALLLTGTGIPYCALTIARFEKLALNHSDHAQLLASVRTTAITAVAFAGMAVVGIMILVICLLHQLRAGERTRKEAEILRRRNEEAEKLNRNLRDLAHHQRLETIGTLTSSIAHEFNNLLTPIMGYSLMALEKLDPEQDPMYDDLLEVYNASRKAKVIISRLSDLSRKNSDGTFHRVSPDELVRRTLSVAGPAKPEAVELKLNLNCMDQRIWANEIQLSQLLLNLILNGFQAMGEESGTLTIHSTFDEDSVHFLVEDTGCGIPETIRDQIFEPFFTTKSADRGTGLGLAIAAQVVEDHKGSIRVDSEEGQGTRVLVTLPRNNVNDIEK